MGGGGVNIQSALVRSILEQWRHYEWTIQGFGFARTKIADVGRIHVWDSRLRMPTMLADVHAHPWPLYSTIISGELINCRFADLLPEAGLPYMRSLLKTGEGGGLVGEPTECKLSLIDNKFYTAGQSYSQEPEEIHRTQAQDGTVTLLERPQGPPLQETYTYWPAGTAWISAEPRKPRSEYELGPIIELALARWSAA
jgi:hypothetical protein